MVKKGFKSIALLCICSLLSIHAKSTEASLEDQAKNLIHQAAIEKSLVVYSVLSNKAAQPLVDAFQAKYPAIHVEYDGEGGSTETYERFLTETKLKKPTADVVWSSAMDLQMKLVSEGYAAKYRSVESDELPEWANYQDMAWGTTYEPVVIVYNKQLLPSNQVPVDHSSFSLLLDKNQAQFQGKVTSFDLSKSGVGYMFAVQDQIHSDTWSRLQRSIGNSNPHLAAGTGEMLKRINSGDSIVGYNIMGSYALSRSQKDLPNLAVIYPTDFTPVLSRVMFINVNAAHPSAAKLWVDFVLSKQGQKIIGDSLELNAIRDDAEAKQSARKMKQILGNSARLIPIEKKLADTLESNYQNKFLQQWRDATFQQSYTSK